MSSTEPPQGAPARRPRRAVRLAGTVGGDDANLVSSHPAPRVDAHRDDAPRDLARGDAAAAAGRKGDSGPTNAPPGHEPAVATRSADDSDVGWGDREAGSNDDRLHQDKPPHW
ncbi:hypothetical protein ASD16_12145 [Cellulomonas sp. Root485]|uniref:hypothetical protein n=1 Tax=Cellulomonas sp. Root485 TaxID=1736546 RepID=UPI0006FE8F66|nr:hypothetical protein [Cellulomonas sp. Root485]KQY23298.1 hypothetical protein ASD16_12145 [Cellulomonas sp. Root485]